MATNGVNGVNGHTNGVHLPALSTSAEDFNRHGYDYVIVGGGTAGLAVAARLTENSDVTVGVLEAGSNKLGDMLVDCPAMFLQMFSNPEYDWQHMTVPQVGCLENGVVVLVLKVADVREETQSQQSSSHPAGESSRRQ